MEFERSALRSETPTKPSVAEPVDPPASECPSRSTLRSLLEQG
ncbi:hypothetical protein [Halobiforma nitratireducens]|nr:hypothetical protein [Halobiforma nitratireducens]